MSRSITPPRVGGQDPAGAPRWVWAVVMVLVAALVAGVAGVLAYAGGAGVPDAIRAAGGAFATVMLVALALAVFLGGRG